MSDIRSNNGKKTKHWVGPDPITPEADQQLMEYPPAFRQVLFNRGFDTVEKAHKFLQGMTEEYDPFLMKGMDKAVELILDAIKDEKNIVIYGDYDVDGVTATALLVQAIRYLGGIALEYIPNRFDEGYGLNSEAIETLKDQSADLIVTVDCGIRSVREAERARELGIKLVISDHHHPKEMVPLADAVICPRQDGDEYPYKELTGVGIAYKIARALFQQSGRNPAEAEQWLDLVALGTVSDIAPLTDENRLLVKRGLKMMQTKPRQGIFSLIAVADIRQPSTLTAVDIGFKLGPRLNAAGRMESASDALRLLMTDDPAEAGLLAQGLQVQNVKRQEQTTANQEFAEEQLGIIDDLPIIVAFGSEEQFHSGIVGLVAARLVERHYRPAVVGVIGEEFTRASCRSIDEFHITKALDQCADLMVRHGGHSKAAGFTVRNENRDELKEKLMQIASSQLPLEELVPTICYDADINLDVLRDGLFPLQEQLEPTGCENPRPVFMTRGLMVKDKKRIGKDKNHLRLILSNGNFDIDAIAFRMGERADDLTDKVDLVYSLEENNYNGKTTLQLNVRDIRPIES